MRLNAVAAAVTTIVLFVSPLAFAQGQGQGKKKGDLSLLRVIDSTGTTVGPVVNFRNIDPQSDGLLSALTFLTVNDDTFPVVVFRGHFMGAGDKNRLFFDLPNCFTGGGLPIMLPESPPLFGPSVVLPPGQTVYIEGLPYAGPVLSVYQNGQCDPASGNVQAFLAEPVVDLDTLFTPPFSVGP